MKTIVKYPVIDRNKCVACGQCEMHCPPRAIKVVRNEENAVISPCMGSCPAYIDVPGYIALAREGRYEDAYRLIRKNNPFPSVCGRICTHPCQEACNRSYRDDSVGIRDIKRFVSDYVFAGNEVIKEHKWDPNGKKVAIIGAGPSGMSCAYYLALTGYEVEVFESEDRAGGVLLYGIPEYRLPKDVLQREIDAITDLGVTLHLSTEIGKDVSMKELQEKFDSVYVSTGTQFSRKAGIPGENLENVYHGLDFLKEINLGRKPYIGNNVVVIGGGNTAIDAAREAVRAGAENVTILYRRRRQEMPADFREIIEALEEGIKIKTQSAPMEFIAGADGKVCSIRCARTEMLAPDEKGRRACKVVEGDEFEVEADTVVVAVSQYSDFPFISKEEVVVTKWGGIEVDSNMMSKTPGLFAGGDVVRGSDTAITAIADGKKAAIGINKYLGCSPILNDGAEIELPARDEHVNFQDVQHKMPMISIEERKKSNVEVATGLSEEALREECKRCMRCTGKAEVTLEHCIDCRLCAEYCTQDAITYEFLDEPRIIHHADPSDENLDKAIEILRKAKWMPYSLFCVCTMTTTMEAMGAILDGGAHDLVEISRKTGTRGGCGGIYCIGNNIRLLEAAGYPQTPPEDGQWCNSANVNIQNIPDEIADEDPKRMVRESQKIDFNEEDFMAQIEKYKKERSARNGQNH